MPPGGDIKGLRIWREEACSWTFSGWYARDLAVLIGVLFLEHRNASLAAACINPFRCGIVKDIVAVPGHGPLAVVFRHRHSPRTNDWGVAGRECPVGRVDRKCRPRVTSITSTVLLPSAATKRRPLPASKNMWSIRPCTSGRGMVFLQAQGHTRLGVS